MYSGGIGKIKKNKIYFVIDCIIFQLSLFSSYFIRNSGSVFFDDKLFISICIFLLVINIIMYFSSKYYYNILNRGYWVEFITVLKKTGITVLILTFYLFLLKESAYFSRLVMLMTACMFVIIDYIIILLLKLLQQEQLLQEKNLTRLLIISNTAEAKKTITELSGIKNSKYLIVGAVVIDNDLEGSYICKSKVVANKDNMYEYICREWIDEVIICYSKDDIYPENIINKLSEMGVVTHYRVAFLTDLETNTVIDRVGKYTVCTSAINNVTPIQIFLKRLMDIVGGLIGCILAIVMFLVIAPMLYIKSPAPIIFSQTRVGKNGKKFKLYKFRSMYPDAETRKKELMSANQIKDGMMFKLDNDPRIIGSKLLADGKYKKGIGNFIRDWSIDEFPQFFNVLKGDMSLVGTRPPTVDEWYKYKLHHRVRLAIKPGITGLWQISGRSNITDFEEVVKLDANYITEWNLGRDIRIIFKTFFVVIRRDGAK